MLYHMCEKSKREPTWQQLEHAIRRNFGGLESTEWSPFEVFEKLLLMSHELPDLSGIPKEVATVVTLFLAIIIYFEFPCACSYIPLLTLTALNLD